MSTGLFSDEENGYNIDETKFKLKLGAQAPTPDANSLDGLEDMGGDLGDLEDMGGDAPVDDKPFDDEPFDAGVEADEESDPKTFIQQLAGKLGQSLRSYSGQQGNPDFDLEKFAVNSVLSATHTGQMDDSDQKDIIDKVKSAGNDKNNVDVNVDVDTNSDNTDANVDTTNDGGDNSAPDLGGEDVAKENFKLGEGKTPTKSLVDSEKKRNFVTKAKIMSKLNEMSEVEPIVKPTTKPSTPDVKPSRRQKPWRPSVQPKTNPKASDVLSEGNGASGKIIDVKFLDSKIAILKVSLDDNEIDMKFENSGEFTEKPVNVDEPWLYIYKSVNAPDEKNYTVRVEFNGNPETNLDVSGVADDYIEEKK